MFNKDELLSKDVAELLDIAANIGADVKSGDDKESVIYSILDRQAVAESLNAPVVKRKRTRIAKKDTDHVYSVNGKEGENFDVKKNKISAEPSPSLFKDEISAQPSQNEIAEDTPAEAQPVAPKRRGRKPKAVKEAEEAEKARLKAEAELQDVQLNVEADEDKDISVLPDDISEDVPEQIFESQDN